MASLGIQKLNTVFIDGNLSRLSQSE